jgi:predicted HTH transcriptional regulator
VANEVSGDDLSLTSIQWAVGRHQKKFGASRGEEDPFEFLARMGLVERQHCGTRDAGQYRVTLAALILFGKEAALSRVLSNCETVVSSEGGHVRIRRNVVESIRELVYSEKSPIRQRCQQVSQEMLLELLMNAYIHRCWRTPGPIMIRVDQFLEIQNPGDLMPGLHVANLLHCVPSYRNFLLAESSRYAGLCDKLGKGIGMVFDSALKGGLDIPIFESENNSFTARLSLVRSDDFREFVRARSSSLSSMDEILVLRALWERKDADVQEIAQVLQRGFEQSEAVLRGMEKKLMVERAGNGRFLLSSGIRSDIDHIFQADQMHLFRH